MLRNYYSYNCEPLMIEEIINAALIKLSGLEDQLHQTTGSELKQYIKHPNNEEQPEYNPAVCVDRCSSSLTNAASLVDRVETTWKQEELTRDFGCFQFGNAAATIGNMHEWTTCIRFCTPLSEVEMNTFTEALSKLPYRHRIRKLKF